MNFLIVAFHPRSMTPYAEQYENGIKKAGHEYDIIFWDRFSNAPLEKCGNEYIFHQICTLGGNRLKKLYPFYLFRKTVKKIIRCGKYDKIIILNTMPGFLIHDILLRKYRDRYILDIRDYTYEKYRYYYVIVKKLIDNSFFTAISSRGFKKFLGENSKFIINHNISNLKNCIEWPTLSLNRKPVRIGFVGAVRYFDENVALIESLKELSNFKLIFIGKALHDCHLEEYCKKNEYQNVVFCGAFQNSEKPKLYNDIDIINSLYGNGSLEVRSALPNRLYDALIFKKPILTTKGTYLSEIVRKYKIGLVLDSSTTYCKTDYIKSITDYVNSFDATAFVKNANYLLEIVKSEQLEFHKRIQEFVN